MEKVSLEKHTSKQFTEELEGVREQVLVMGGLVERQIADAIRALLQGDGTLGAAVAHSDYKVNGMEIEIDEQCARILARRQPQAGDLRLLLAIAKTVTDLERIGDEAEKIGRLASGLASKERFASAFEKIDALGRHVRAMVRNALDAFARMDVDAAIQVVQADTAANSEYEGIVRQCITYMMADPRNIRAMLDVMWAAKALERVGDHATNVGEYIVYFVRGKDVRHIGVDGMEET